MDQGGSGGPSEKGSDDGYALVLEPVGFTKRLYVGCTTKKGQGCLQRF